MDDEQKEQTAETSDANQNTEQPQESEPSKKSPASGSHWDRFRTWYSTHKKWSIPASVVLLIVILLAIPWSRYKAAGLVIKKNFKVSILDSTSHTPVSGALVSAGSISAQTDGNGKVSLHLGAGHHQISISKKYYQDSKTDILVPILSQKSTPGVNLIATGRQVKIVVKNLVTQKTLANVDIKVADITAKTDKNGAAIVVLPAGSTTQKTTLSLSGYNNSSVSVKISDKGIAQNDFNLTPAGQVYFLSKRTGKLDLMKINLDGSSVQTVVAGTGNEHDYDTVVMPSADWKYVALLAKRSATDPTPQLYVLSTADDKLLNADSGNANFTLIGWSGDSLIYYATRNDVQTWQTGKDKLKSYDATSGKIVLLDQSAATGDSSASAYEYYALVDIFGDNVLYAKNWTQIYNSYQPNLLSGKQDTIALINTDGQGHKAVASYDATNNVQYTQHDPSSIYIWQQIDLNNSKFFDYSIGLAAPKSVDLNSDQFYQLYPTYIVSPSGKQTFWSENRDGKNSLFVGDNNGQNSSTIATLSEYAPYNWFSDDYLLVTKGNSELYIMGAKGGKTLKITDYQPTSNRGGY